MATNPEEAGAGGTAPAHNEHIDACLCDVSAGVDAADATPDDQLPVAAGCVEAAPSPAAHDENDVDGCDAIATTADYTRDDELPAATGGVF